ncbi:MAG: GNAT family N-acetyltransferase [Dehalococcoidia bacterium]
MSKVFYAGRGKLDEMEPLIDIHDMEAADEYFVSTCTHVDESEEIDACARRRLSWLQKMHGKGLRVKVAAIRGRHTGFLYAIPIECSPWGPLGRRLLVITCLYVLSNRQGVGKALLNASEEEARRQGLKGIVTTGYRHDFWFMPAGFFEANGFVECARADWKSSDTGSAAILLWKTLGGGVRAPTLLRPDYRFRPVPGRVVIDLFWNTFCQTSDMEAQRVREVASKFGDSVVLNEYCVDDRAVLLRHQISRGIFVDGREIGWGYEAPKEGIREAIAQALSR